jgi:hypothetical protein
MSIENNQEQLRVPAEIGSTTPVESTPEIPTESIQNTPVVSPESAIPVQSSPEEQEKALRKVPPRIVINGAGEGIGWFALIDKKEEGGDIEVL